MEKNTVQVAAKKTKKEQQSVSKNDASNSLGKLQGHGQVGQDSGSGSKVKTSVYDLPVEMLTKILKNVDTQSLFACRLVHPQWSSISSPILTARSDALLKFEFDDLEQKMTLSNSSKAKKEEENSLWDFIELMRKSKNCAYARFHFSAHNPKSFFDYQDWIAFLSYFDPSNQNQNQNQRTKLKYLYLDFDDPSEVHAFKRKLRDLLLIKIPGLEELGLSFVKEIDVPKINLFPSLKFKTRNKNTKNSIPVELPDLKVLHFADSLLRTHPLIVQDLLNAAVNLKSIRVTGHAFSFNTFQFLHSLGKLHLLQNAEIKVDQSFLAEMKKQPLDLNFLLALKLHELKLQVAGDLEPMPNSCAAAANFISLLLESSKNSLRKLELEPLGFLQGLEFSRFTNLEKLSFYQLWGSQQPSFPPGTRSKDIFPVVSALDFRVANFAAAFPQEDSIPRLPNVKTRCLIDRMVSENIISVLNLMCPNLKKFEIQKDNDADKAPALNLLKIGRAIWTHMTQLESLEVDLDLDAPENNPHALDSCFTGFSMENCQRLYAERGFQINVPELELQFLRDREHPSILNMKDLKNLTINPYSGTKLLEKQELFSSNLTWISHQFAFELMPNLAINED